MRSVIGGRQRATVGLLALASYVALLLRWFNDPGQPTVDGWLLRSRVVWPFALAFLGLAGACAYLWRARLACLARDLRRGLALARVDGVILAARAADSVTDDFWYAIAGVLIGIGFWTQPLVATTGLAGAATVLYFKGQVSAGLPASGTIRAAARRPARWLTGASEDIELRYPMLLPRSIS